jgi:hypothetical protein
MLQPSMSMVVLSGIMIIEAYQWSTAFIICLFLSLPRSVLGYAVELDGIWEGDQINWGRTEEIMGR